MVPITEQSQIRRLKEIVSSIGIGDVPIVVAFMTAVCGWVIFEYGGYSGGMVSGLSAYADPTLYIVSIFLHEGWSAYIASMYFFVPAGVALTYMTNNRNVLGVVVATHVATVLISGLAWEMESVGTTGVAYGVLAATMVRAMKIGCEKYTERTQQAGPMGVQFVATLGLLMLITTTDGGFQYAPILVGFVFGGSYESARVYLEIRRVRRTRVQKKEEGSSFDFTHED